MNITRLIAPAVLLTALCACGGGGGSIFNPGGGNGGGINYCNTGTAQQLANPLPGQYVNGSVNSITIVANGNNDNLYTNPSNWYVYLTNGNSGQTVTGNQLTLTPYPGGPQPYNSDFYYSSSLQQSVPQGTGTWSAYLANYSGNCSALPLGSFST